MATRGQIHCNLSTAAQHSKQVDHHSVTPPPSIIQNISGHFLYCPNHQVVYVNCPCQRGNIHLVAMKCYERLVMAHINIILPDTLDPLQFVYRPNRSTDDAISITLPAALSHLDKRNTYSWSWSLHTPSQIHLLNSVFHNSWHLILVKIRCLRSVGSPLYFKNVKCQNNSRENYLFQLVFLS